MSHFVNQYVMDDNVLAAIRNLFQEIDLDGDHEIEFSEFHSLRPNPETAAMLVELFTGFHKEQSGIIKPQDFENGFHQWASTFIAKQHQENPDVNIDELFQETDDLIRKRIQRMTECLTPLLDEMKMNRGQNKANSPVVLKRERLASINVLNQQHKLYINQHCEYKWGGWERDNLNESDTKRNVKIIRVHQQGMMYDVSEIDRNGNLSHFHHNVPRDYLRKPTRRGSVINSSPTNGTRKKLHLSGLSLEMRTEEINELNGETKNETEKEGNQSEIDLMSDIQSINERMTQAVLQNDIETATKLGQKSQRKTIVLEELRKLIQKNGTKEEITKFLCKEEKEYHWSHEILKAVTDPRYARDYLMRKMTEVWKTIVAKFDNDRTNTELEEHKLQYKGCIGLNNFEDQIKLKMVEVFEFFCPTTTDEEKGRVLDQMGIYKTLQHLTHHFILKNADIQKRINAFVQIEVTTKTYIIMSGSEEQADQIREEAEKQKQNMHFETNGIQNISFTKLQEELKFDYENPNAQFPPGTKYATSLYTEESEEEESANKTDPITLKNGKEVLNVWVPADKVSQSIGNLFNLLDTTKDGAIDMNDLKKADADAEGGLSNHQRKYFKFIIDMIDVDGDQSINGEEFKLAMYNLANNFIFNDRTIQHLCILFMQKKFDELLYFLQLDLITPTNNEVEAKENENNENNMLDDTNDEEPILQDNVTYNAKISLSPTYKLPDAEGKQVTLEEALSIFSFQPGALANIPKFYLEVENTGKKRFPNDAKIYSVKGNTRENRKITVSQSGIFRCPVPFNSGNDFESGLKSTIRLVTGNPLGNGSSCCCNEWNKSKKIKNTPPCNGQFEGACIYDGIRIPQGKGLKRIWLRMGSETVLGRLFGEPFELKFFYGLGNDGSTEEKETRRKLYGAVKEEEKEKKEEQINGEQKEEQNNGVKTGIAHDAQQIMSKHRCEQDQYHPECPARISCITQAFATASLFPNSDVCTNVPIRPATDEEIHANGRGHSLKHIAYVEKICTTRTTSQIVNELDEKSLYKNQYSLQAAKHSCGASLSMTEAVIRGDVQNGMVVARPPGHHAEPCACMGFCFYNNVGVSVLKAQDLGTKKILIVDWDVHHGNGTQEMFAEDPNVLFVSLHRYDNGTFYPCEDETKVRGTPEFTGRGEGRGATINIAWNTKQAKVTNSGSKSRSSSSTDGTYLGGIGDVDYLEAFKQIVLPAAREFQPNLIYISAGFDAAAGDQLGQMNVTPNGFGLMTQQLMEVIVNVPVIIVLEGGYNLNSISNSAVACLEALTKRKRFEIEGNEEPTTEGLNAIEATKLGHLKCSSPPAWAEL